MDQPYERFEPTSNSYRIPFGLLAFSIVTLPFCSFLFCILWSILYFFERSTSTHCDVVNYLPSISAAIGNYQPQRFIWQSSILLQVLPRLLIAKYYLNYFHENIYRARNGVAYVVCSLNVIENFALVGLSVWTSSNDYEMHKYCFIVFIISSELYMISSYYLFKDNQRRGRPIGRLEQKSLNVKRYLFLINIFCIALAVYFFNRHNTYCEAGVYTLFALAEYIVVLTNMGFHMTAYWDLNDKRILLDCSRGISIKSDNTIKYNRII